MKQLKVILSGGGTGGHIFPAIAIANAIKKINPNAEILFVGALGKMEMEKVPAAGFNIIGIPIAGLQRKFTLSNFKLPFLILQSLFKTKKIIRDFKPNVVVGTGGYASGPLLRTAMNSGIPALIQEQNSYAGVTNKLLSKKAKKICVAYENMERFFPKEKIILTGNPIRQDLIHLNEKKEEAYKHFGLKANKKTILIIGGSLGARTINEAVENGLEKFVQEDIQLIWQTGKLFYKQAIETRNKFSTENFLVFDFISRMDLAYAIADVVISRAGASSVSELCNIGLPSILVPSPNVAEDHQTKNAMALVNKNAAWMVKDSEAKSNLVSKAIELLHLEEIRKELIRNIKTLAFLDSAMVIANHVIQLANEDTRL